MAKRQNKNPIQNGYAKKVPFVMQMEALECGAASLTMILAYYGKFIPLEQVRSDCGVSRDGSNAKNIIVAARNYGFVAKGFRYEADGLKKNGSFPCIIHWNFNHFVVLNGFKGEKAVINDPAKGTYTVPMKTFEESFTGICLMFEPGETFTKSGKPKSVMQFAKDRLRGAKAAIAFMVLTTLITSLVGIINPAFSRILVDRLLTGENPNWFLPFIIALSVLSAIQIISGWIGALFSLQINGKLSAVGSTTYMWHVLQMPMKFFSQRMAGDIQNRKSYNAEIANSLVNTFAPLVLDTAMMVFYLVVMLRYSVLLSLVGIFSIFINLVLSKIISDKRINITRVQMRDSGKLAGATVAGIEMIETIKASGAENGFFEKWAGYQAGVNTAQVKYAKLNQYLGMLPSIVSSLAGSAVLIIGVYLVMIGEFTPGMIMAFQGFLTAFNAPAAKLISTGQTLQEMRTDMERVEDVMKYPAQEYYYEDGENIKKLSGNLEIKNLTFGYSELAEPLITDFNLNLKQGKSVAFVGASGSGKSTLSKLISGLYEPWSGQILFDGKQINKIDRAVFTGSLSVVDQDIILFEDTIANNIKMWDTTIEDFEMILAARDAQIHEDILKRGGYNTKLLEGGKDFSGGQRQRLEIARVLAQDPTIIILDEATAALDAKTEYDVVSSIKDRGISCIVIAHRLSTIRDCDEIIVFSYGKVVERGTHDELMKNGKEYAQLVSNE